MNTNYKETVKKSKEKHRLLSFYHFLDDESMSGEGGGIKISPFHAQESLI